MRSDVIFQLLQAYHLTVSVIAALSAVMVMQAVGHDWPTAAFSRSVQWVQRAGLGLLSITLFCSGIRMPFLPEVEFVALMSAAAVNSCVLCVLAPTALLGRERTVWLWH